MAEEVDLVVTDDQAVFPRAALLVREAVHAVTEEAAIAKKPTQLSGPP